MGKKRKNGAYRQKAGRFQHVTPPKNQMSFRESAVDSKGPAKEILIQPNLPAKERLIQLNHQPKAKPNQPNHPAKEKRNQPNHPAKERRNQPNHPAKDKRNQPNHPGKERMNQPNHPAKERLIQPNHPVPQAMAKSKKRMMKSVVLPTINVEKKNYSWKKDYSGLKRKKTGTPSEYRDAAIATPRNLRAAEATVPSVPYRRHHYSYSEQDIYINEPHLTCSICNSQVLMKFMELHAWMHLSWTVQVGDRNPFQCTYCDFAAFRIPDVVCHSKEIHGNVGANLFVPTVSHEILQFFFRKVMECFPPINYINVYHTANYSNLDNSSVN